MIDRDAIHAIWAKLEVGGEPSLFLMSAQDGSINRQGTGSAENMERDLFIGLTGPQVFLGLRAQVPPRLLEWCGQSLSDPDPRGKTCRLTVAFVLGDGAETATG